MVQVEKAKRGQAASSLSLRSASCMLMLSTCLNMRASPSCMPIRSYPPAFGKRLAQLWVEAPVEPNVSLRSWIDFLVKLSTYVQYELCAGPSQTYLLTKQTVSCSRTWQCMTCGWTQTCTVCLNCSGKAAGPLFPTRGRHACRNSASNSAPWCSRIKISYVRTTASRT